MTTDAFGLAWDGQYLVFARRPGYVDWVDPVTGALVETLETPVQYDHLRSVTAHDGRVWGGGWFRNFVLLDSEGAVGVAYTDRYQGDSENYPELIAFVGDDLAIVEDFRVFFFTPTPR